LIALAGSPHRHNRSVNELLIQTFYDDLAELKEFTLSWW